MLTRYKQLQITNVQELIHSTESGCARARLCNHRRKVARGTMHLTLGSSRVTERNLQVVT